MMIKISLDVFKVYFLIILTIFKGKWRSGMKLTAGGNIFIKKIAVMFGFYSLQKKGVPKFLLYFTDIKDFSTVPELRSCYSKSWPHTKLRYTNRTAPVERPFLLAGELASPAAEF